MLSLAKRIFVLLLCGLAANALAHRYFFSITDIALNDKTQAIEVIHQITTHDINNAIADAKQIHFSVAHPEYESYIRQYLETHFQMHFQGQAVPLNWVGLEVSKGNIFLYQEAPFPHALTGLQITNNLLIERYKKQINTVNYRDNVIKGSLTFNRSVTIKHIEINN